jgi:hypothetical protein
MQVEGRGSWSRAMRPDCSIKIRPLSGIPGQDAEVLETWLHFDAKYRVERLADQFQTRANDEADAAEAEAVESLGQSKREDLLKMHAYRDAIRRTAGAYVLFPGDERATFQLDTETLPGIGAIPLRPGQEGETTRGLTALEGFLSEVLRHTARQATRHERARFWSARITQQEVLPRPLAPPMEDLALPPADTLVLLVAIDTREAFEDLLNSSVCRVTTRGAKREQGWAVADADFVLVHGLGAPYQALLRREGDWFAAASELCCRIRAVDETPWWINELDLEPLLKGSDSSPVVSWLALLALAARLDLDEHPAV